MKPFLTFLIVLSLLARVACAESKPDFPPESKIKAAVLAAFLKQANNHNSALGKAIVHANDGMKDGRNEKGGISMPVKHFDVRVIQLSAETITNPWHYGETHGAYRVASSGENTFLVLLTTRIGVHMAQETDTLFFTVDARELWKVKIPKGWTGGFDFEQGAPSPVIRSIQVDDFKLASLTEKA